MGNSLVSDLAALMYYDNQKESGSKKKRSFEKSAKDIQDMWLKRSENVILAIDKCNMRVIGKESIVTHEDRNRDLNKITAIIEDFVKKLDFKKLNSPNYFPAQELAMRIYD